MVGFDHRTGEDNALASGAGKQLVTDIEKTTPAAQAGEGSP